MFTESDESAYQEARLRIRHAVFGYLRNIEPPKPAPPKAEPKGSDFPPMHTMRPAKPKPVEIARTCKDCHKPTNRNKWAPRCLECAAIAVDKNRKEAQKRSYRRKHPNAPTIVTREYLDLAALAESIQRKRGIQTFRIIRTQLGVSEGTINSIALAKQRPSLPMLIKICKWLEVPYSTFLKGVH